MYGATTSCMENQMESDMKTEGICCCIGIRVSKS